MRTVISRGLHASSFTFQQAWMWHCPSLLYLTWCQSTEWWREESSGNKPSQKQTARSWKTGACPGMALLNFRPVFPTVRCQSIHTLSWNTASTYVLFAESMKYRDGMLSASVKDSGGAQRHETDWNACGKNTRNNTWAELEHLHPLGFKMRVPCQEVLV